MTARILLCAPSAEFKERAEKIWEKDFAEERQGIFQCELELE